MRPALAMIVYFTRRLETGEGRRTFRALMVRSIRLSECHLPHQLNVTILKLAKFAVQPDRYEKESDYKEIEHEIRAPSHSERLCDRGDCCRKKYGCHP